MNNIFDEYQTPCPLDNYIKTHGTIAGFAGKIESLIEKNLGILRLFVWTILSQCQWDFAPYNYVCDLYYGWYAKCRFLNPPLSSMELINQLSELAYNLHSPWGEGPYGYDADFVFQAMGKPEPMISEYGLTAWTQFQFGVNSDNFEAFTNLESYYGLRRVTDPVALASVMQPYALEIAVPPAPTVR